MIWCSMRFATCRIRCIKPSSRRWPWCGELQPRRAWFTHIAHELPHSETNARLIDAGFPNVALAYDGLHFEVRV